jgi:hypothetical protein
MLKVVSLLVLFSSPALAGDAKVEERETKVPAVTVHDFDGVAVQAKAARPWSWFIDGRKSAKFESLIVLRSTFDREIKHSASEVQ